jgi:CRP-like cAMP-binding protein
MTATTGSDPNAEQLQQVALFRGLSAEAISEIVKSALLRRLTEDETYFFQGDEATRIFVLVEGRVKLTQITPEGQQVLLKVISPWTLFGGVAIGEKDVYPVTAQSAENTAALSWSKQDLMKAVHLYPQLAVNAMQVMASNVQEFQDRFREMATERVERRLARVLVRLAGQTGRKTEEGVLIDMALTRQDLAEMIGTTLYTVSRILSHWETQGLVALGRERVVIRYPHGLVMIAEDLK